MSDTCGDTLDEHSDWSPVNMVFALEMLRELILDYAIRDNRGKLCERNIGVVRLLQKCWQDSVSKVLTRNHKPLYNLTLDKDNSLTGTPFVDANGKLLDQFVKLVNNRIEKTFPTFRLEIREEFFQLENYDSFHNFLRDCGQGLVELELYIPKEAGYLPCLFSNVTFPNLLKMTATFTGTNLEIPPNSVPLGDTNALVLIQCFLNASASLNALVFNSNDCIPHGFQYIFLPASITKLDISCILKGPQLEILSRNTLSNLTSLELMVTHNLFSEGVLTLVLQKLRQTLRNLEFYGLIYSEPSNAVNMVTFPVMEKLEELTINTINLELDSDMHSFDKYFPKLRSWKAWNQTRNMLYKWTSDFDSPPSKLEDVVVQLVDENVSHGKRGYTLPLLLEDMQRIHSTFPNVSNLWLELTAEQTCGIKFLFMEMKQLTELTLYIHDPELTVNADFWDSILTGIPLGIIAGMREHQDFWEFMEFTHEKIPSIRMLTKLKSLRLETVDQGQVEYQDLKTTPLISDVTFKFAFLKMNNLQCLFLFDRFKASKESTQAWQSLQRVITNN